MSTHLTPAEARRRPAPDLIAQLDALPDLELLKLSDELVLALPDDVLTWRRDKLLSSRKGVSMKQVAPIIGTGDKHAQRLRKNYLATGVESFDALPAPDPILSDDDIRTPNDGKTSRGGSARWTLDVLVRWLIEYERVDETRRGSLTLILRPGGRKPPGRTPLPRVLAML